MASAVARNELGVVITSSPDCTPSASRPTCSAAVPLLSATQCLMPQKSANSRSKASTSGPWTNVAVWQTRSSAGEISSRNSAYSDCRSSNGTFITVAFSAMEKLYARAGCITSLPRHSDAQMCVSVPVTLVRRSAQPNTRNDSGIRIAEKSSRAAMEGHSSRHPAPASGARSFERVSDGSQAREESQQTEQHAEGIHHPAEQAGNSQHDLVSNPHLREILPS